MNTLPRFFWQFALTVSLGAASAAASAQSLEAPASAPVATPAQAAEPVVPADLCRPLTDQATAADFKAASAQAQRKSADELSALFDEAINSWQRAGDACAGRAKERALRNLQDSRKSRAALNELLDSGAQCASSHKDADALHELAKQASTERRWLDASLLFRKAENMWELAAESCTGNQQQQALKRRDEAETDGHNTEFCAPLFDRARSLSQKLRGAAGAVAEEKARASMLSETAWRDAASQCRGSALESAKNNAQSVARERGTAWVATREAGVAAPPALPLVTAAAAASSPLPLNGLATPTAAAAAVKAAAVGTLAVPISVQVPVPVSAAVATAQPSTYKGGSAMPGEFSAGSTRFSGSFAVDSDGTTYSGRGKVLWENGDVYDGPLVKGQRQGEGQFVWASGQRYTGQWVQDQPRGTGQMSFPNGNRYEGRVEDGRPHGQGVMKYASGDEFTGQLQRGSPSGRGVYLWAAGQRFEGEWLLGVAQGAGTLKFANGDVFEGPVLDGVPSGAGRLVYANGDAYTGNFKNGRPDGEGRFAWKVGDSYTGQWRNGLKDGVGVMSWANGDRWEGRFSNDEQADGKLIRKPG